jgi:hypothetical protein
MTARQFSQWCDDGKPALNAEHARLLPAMTKPKVDALVRAVVDRERANTQAALETLASIIGDETGQNERRLRDHFTAEIDKLRAEICRLERGLDGGDPLDLPNWRSHHVEH